MRVIYILTIFFFVISCQKNEKKTMNDGYYRFLTFGMPDFNEYIIKKKVDEKWNIKYISVAGCVVTEKLLDSIKIENQKTNSALEKKFGKDWKKLYEKDVQNIVTLEVDIMDILITDNAFKEKLRKCNIRIDDITKVVTPMKNSSIYKVDILEPQIKRKICFAIEVNIKTRTIKLMYVRNHP